MEPQNTDLEEPYWHHRATVTEEEVAALICREEEEELEDLGHLSPIRHESATVPQTFYNLMAVRSGVLKKPELISNLSARNTTNEVDGGRQWVLSSRCSSTKSSSGRSHEVRAALRYGDELALVDKACSDCHVFLEYGICHHIIGMISRACLHHPAGMVCPAPSPAPPPIPPRASAPPPPPIDMVTPSSDHAVDANNARGTTDPLLWDDDAPLAAQLAPQAAPQDDRQPHPGAKTSGSGPRRIPLSFGTAAGAKGKAKAKARRGPRKPKKEPELPTREYPFAGASFVFTGELKKLTRKDAERPVRALGGKVQSSVTRNTDYLVVGSYLKDGRAVTSTTKYEAAMALNNDPSIAKKVLVLYETDIKEILDKQELPQGPDNGDGEEAAVDEGQPAAAAGSAKAAAPAAGHSSGGRVDVVPERVRRAAKRKAGPKPLRPKAAARKKKKRVVEEGVPNGEAVRSPRSRFVDEMLVFKRGECPYAEVDELVRNLQEQWESLAPDRKRRHEAAYERDQRALELRRSSERPEPPAADAPASPVLGFDINDFFFPSDDPEDTPAPPPQAPPSPSLPPAAAPAAAAAAGDATGPAAGAPEEPPERDILDQIFGDFLASSPPPSPRNQPTSEAAPAPAPAAVSADANGMVGMSSSSPIDVEEGSQVGSSANKRLIKRLVKRPRESQAGAGGEGGGGMSCDGDGIERAVACERPAVRRKLKRVPKKRRVDDSGVDQSQL
ncbi:unnamed protein product [Vitrella brassicaformis CCMP3155]|uniref:BRCT domain-containing protein n=4 Tax=Vitrella brassicaformis TaxID=1169539 RepID=A0A0G4GIL0_VITBC|nr:unnamed protein product [Vitrella brassicaformis CCMP3155]|eukprot:CEM29669.1 unnamed protein product [Vitrella brassicaformis CCMP3155]